MGDYFLIGVGMIMVAASGCASTREHAAAMPAVAAELAEVPAISTDALGTSHVRLATSAESPPHILVLSSGGVNGAFPAGVLVGWSQSGARPSFDVVTGVSAGALLATYAFLGAEYDAELERQYKTLEAAQIYRRRALVTLPWSDAIADSEPLRSLIASAITADVLARVAEEHRKGRRLYVGTTNVDTQRLVVWDLGAVALGDDPDKLELFRTVLLASASVPALLPPVPINIEVNSKKYTELHTDGNVSASLFLLPQMLGINESDIGCSREVHAKVYVLIAGKLAPEPAAIPQRIFNVVGASLKGMMQAQMESDLQRLFMLTRVTGSQFHLIGIPQELSISSNPISPDRTATQALFEEGRKRGIVNGPWNSLPPGIAPGDWQRPRGGVRFVAESYENFNVGRAHFRQAETRED